MNEQDMRKVNEALAIIGGVLTIAVALRVLLGPDTVTRLKMATYRRVSVTAKEGADALLSLAANADTAYHRLTNVSA